MLVNNAGFGAMGPVDQLDAARQVEMVQVNVAALDAPHAPLVAGHDRAPAAAASSTSASTAGFQAGPFMAVYYATKAYVISFSEALHDELAGRGVKVSCLCPGPTATRVRRHGQDGTQPHVQAAADDRRRWRIGYRGFRRGKLLVVPGWMNYLAAGLRRGSCRELSRSG